MIFLKYLNNLIKLVKVVRGDLAVSLAFKKGIGDDLYLLIIMNQFLFLVLGTKQS